MKNMKSNILFFVIVILCSNISAQELPSLFETVEYLELKLNKAYEYERLKNKEHWVKYRSFKCTINVKNDGRIDVKYSYEFNESESLIDYKYKGWKTTSKSISFYPNHIEEIDQRVYGRYQANGFALHCKFENDECIRETSALENKEPYISYDDEYVIHFDPFLKDKTKNALDHLFNLAIAKSQISQKTDADPFSNINYKKAKGAGPISVPVSNHSSGLNGLKIKIGSTEVNGFLDSGASHIVIPLKLLAVLLERNDIEENQTISYTKIANGDILATYTHNAPTLSIANNIVRNVTISAIEGDVNILIGQSLLSKFKSWEVDNDRSILILNR